MTEVKKLKRKILSNDNGFTLIEMLVVLMIISVLLLIAIPSMTKNNEVAADKGCDATIKLLQTQVHAYEIENIKQNTSSLTLEKLKEEKYVDNITCPNGKIPSFENNIVGPPTS